MSIASCTFEELLLELRLGNLNLHCLVDLLVVAALVVRVILDGGGEKGVDEGRLAESRFASNLSMSIQPPLKSSLVRAYHYGEGSTTLRDNLVSIERQGLRGHMMAEEMHTAG
jgi:hypothetical protein